jgi:acyl-homoserine-lactone acylase
LHGRDVQPDSWWTVPYDAKNPLTTPRGINQADPDVAKALADSVEFMNQNHVAPDVSLGSVQQYQSIPIPGCSDAFGCFNAVQRNGDLPTSGNPAQVNFGSSFIMAVELTRTGPKARTLLTYSESSNPASPHFTDQTQLLSHKQWVTDRFSAADIAASPDLQISVVRG